MKSFNGLEIDHDVVYHRRFWKIQRAFWICWGLLITAAVLGLLGPGIKGKKTVRNEQSKISLTYERVIRSAAPSELKIQTAGFTTKDSQLKLAINRECIEAIEVSKIDPEPEGEEIAGEFICYTFKRSELFEPITVVFSYEAKKSGEIPIRISLNENPVLIAKQFTFP